MTLARMIVLVLVCVACLNIAAAQERRAASDESGDDFGPVVRAYLGYLSAEQGVVDDRASRREISATYYRRNLNRIRALRRAALQIVRASHNDYVPELEAVTRDELGTLLDPTPNPQTFRVGDIVEQNFRFLGAVRSAEIFYVFERLDPYEQAELMRKKEASNTPGAQPTAPNDQTHAPVAHGEAATTRPRRAQAP